MLFARTLVPVVALVVAGCSGSSPEDIFEDGGSSESGGGATGDGGASSTSQTGQGSTATTGQGSAATTGPGGTTSTTGPGGTSSSTVTTGGGDVCGDLLCGATESCGTCPTDCVCAECGDGTCSAPETCEVCPTDCGACTGVCGDLVCEGNEPGTCPQDCGGPGASTGTGGLGNCPPDPCEVGGSFDQTCQDSCVLIACLLDATCCEGSSWSAHCISVASMFCTCT